MGVIRLPAASSEVDLGEGRGSADLRRSAPKHFGPRTSELGVVDLDIAEVERRRACRPRGQRPTVGRSTHIEWTPRPVVPLQSEAQDGIRRRRL